MHLRCRSPTREGAAVTSVLSQAKSQLCKIASVVAMVLAIVATMAGCEEYKAGTAKNVKSLPVHTEFGGQFDFHGDVKYEVLDVGRPSEIVVVGAIGRDSFRDAVQRSEFFIVEWRGDNIYGMWESIGRRYTIAGRLQFSEGDIVFTGFDAAGRPVAGRYVTSDGKAVLFAKLTAQ